MIEDRLQATCFQYAWNNYPETRKLLFHVPNGGKRGKREAAKLKAMGVIAGVPDFLFLWGGVLYAAELKVKGGRVSHAQKMLHKLWEDNGTYTKVIYTIEDFRNWIEHIIYG